MSEESHKMLKDSPSSKMDSLADSVRQEADTGQSPAPTKRIIPFALLLLLTGILILLAVRETQGLWVYPLDDSYIHLSLARQLATDGHWGFGPSAPAFSSSSPGYTLFLALGFLITGPWQGWPLVINTLAGIWLMGQTWKWTPPGPIGPWLWLLIMGVLPWPLLVLLGLEHVLHVCLMLGLMQRLSHCLAEGTWPKIWWLWVVGAMLIRYETGFLLITAAAVSLWKRHWSATIKLLIVGSLPLLLIGAWSASQGGTWLPLSVMLKGHVPGGLAWLRAAVERLYDNPFMLTTLIALLWALTRSSLLLPRQIYWLRLTLGTGLLHLLFAEVGGYRYEAYWLGLALVGLLQVFPAVLFEGRMNVPTWGLVALLLFPLVIRSGFFLSHYPQAVCNIYQQPYQAAQFLSTHYADYPVGVNDIGLATWQGRIQLTDMVGVGDQAVFTLRQRGRFTAAELDRLLAQRNVSLIIGHDVWLGARMPDRFHPVATWTVPDNVILAQETLTFWATQAEASTLRAKLEAFDAQLPPSVIRHFFPVDQ